MMSSEKHIEAVGETDPELTEAQVELLLAMDRNARDVAGSDSEGTTRREVFRAHQVTRTFLKAERETLNSKNVGDDLWSKVAQRLQPRPTEKPSSHVDRTRRRVDRYFDVKGAWFLVAALVLIVGAVAWGALRSPPLAEVVVENNGGELENVDSLDVELLGPPDNHQELYQAETSSGIATIIWVGEPTVEKPEAGS